MGEEGKENMVLKKEGNESDSSNFLTGFGAMLLMLSLLLPAGAGVIEKTRSVGKDEDLRYFFLYNE